MGLEKRSENKTIYLEVKHDCLWQESKTKEPGCVAVEVTNPKTKAVATKYGWQYDTVVGRVVKLEKYDRKYEGARFFGFKFHIVDGPDKFILTAPYQSQFLRRLLRVVPNINWAEPLSITAFKGKKEGGGSELGVWFKQNGETVRVFYTKDNPNGMPSAKQDPNTYEWDFREQHIWLVDKLWNEAGPEIEAAAKRFAPPAELPRTQTDEPEPEAHFEPHAPITDDDVPF